MLCLRVVRCRCNKTNWHNVKRVQYQLQINLIRSSHSHSSAVEIRRRGDDRYMHHIRSKVIYPNKHVNNAKLLSLSQQQLYRTTIDAVQAYLSHHQTSSSSGINIDLSALLNTDDAGVIDRIDIEELKRWLHKMPHIQLLSSSDDTIVVSPDPHIERIDMISNQYPMIAWRNRIDFKTHNYKPSAAADNTVNRIRELIKYFQLHSCFSSHSVEAKMIIGRGLNRELSNAYTHLLQHNIQALTLNHFHHLFGNLGINLLSYFGHILCDDSAKLLSLHSDLIHGRLSSMDEFKRKYNPALDVERYSVLLHFLMQYYPLYFVNRSEYDAIIFGDTQRLSDLEVMPFLFEMKMLMKIGHSLDYINTYHQRLIYHPKMVNRMPVSHGREHHGYYFDIHYHQSKRNEQALKPSSKTRHKLLQKRYKVFSEKQLENGECDFSVTRCTPDIVLSEPVWINNKAIYWFDAKCTKATNCLYDEKRKYQMYRFTKHYGNGAILALGTADLSVVGINDVIILDGSHYL